MASDVAQFLRTAFLKSLQEVKLPNRLDKEFQNLRELMDSKRARRIWSSPASLPTLLPFLYNLNDELADCRVYVEQKQELTKNLFRLNNISHVTYIWNMKKRLTDLQKELVDLIDISVDRDSSSPTSTTSTTISPAYTTHTASEAVTSLIGFAEYEEKVQALLSDGKYKAIGVYGMAGSGKTAFVQKLVSSPSVIRKFQPIIWVCLSALRLDEDAEIANKITKHILFQMGYDVDEWPILNPTITELLEHLKKSLTSKRYLIVFDDVWQVSDFLSNLGQTDTSPIGDTVNRLSFALPKDSGGAVIITSRIKEVTQKMVGGSKDTYMMIHMKPLVEKCKLILNTDVGLFIHKQQIENWLQYRGFKAIGIYGPSYPANTTLIDNVLKSSIVREKFGTIIRVCVSDKVTPDMILSSMLGALNYKADEPMKHHAERLMILKKLLLKQNDYLILLDDVRHLDYWYSDLSHLHEEDQSVSDSDRFSPVLPKDGKGAVSDLNSLHEEDESLSYRLSQALPKDGKGAVIVTTVGIRHVAQYLVGDERLIYVNFAVQNIEPNEIEDLCEGLPLAAKAVADIIRENEIEIRLVSPSAPKGLRFAEQKRTSSESIPKKAVDPSPSHQSK